MTINKQTGCVEIPELSITVSRVLSRETVQQHAAFHGAEILMCNEPWCSYRLPAVALRESRVRVTLQSENQTLRAIGLVHDTPQLRLSWVDWSEAREHQRKAFHDAWLASREVDAPVGRYSWGKIESCLDIKTGDSGICITYLPTVKAF